jgi:hypothetical protein
LSENEKGEIMKSRKGKIVEMKIEIGAVVWKVNPQKRR